MDQKRVHSNSLALLPNQKLRRTRSFSEDTTTIVGDSPGCEYIDINTKVGNSPVHGAFKATGECTPPPLENFGLILSNIGNFITYEYILEKDGQIVTTSSDIHPRPTHVIYNDYSVNLRKVNSSADWKHNFDIIAGKQLSRLTLGHTCTSEIQAPFTSRKYGWDEQSFDEPVIIKVVRINDQFSETTAEMRKALATERGFSNENEVLQEKRSSIKL
ncbi:hypothetical protein B7463_g5956, partial [Scytalidium lignicola]